MVFQIAIPMTQLSGFYGAVMQESLNKKNVETKILKTKELFGEEKLILIEHENTTYRLMITKQGKLILNK